MLLKRIMAVAAVLSAVFMATTVSADERHFTYSYEADVLPRGALEFEQWITNRAGKDDGHFSRWDFRSELEYGLTDTLVTAIYLNFSDTYFSPDDPNLESEREFEFGGISSEWKWQLLNPQIDPVGVVLYAEGTYASDEYELEEKIIVSSNLSESLIFAVNAAIEQEWEVEHGDTVKEGKLELTSGLSYALSPHWSLGAEIRNLREYETFDLSNEMRTVWYAGPVLHYGSASWWATLSVMPQIGIEGSRDLEDQERVDVRLIIGKEL